MIIQEISSPSANEIHRNKVEINPSTPACRRAGVPSSPKFLGEEGRKGGGVNFAKQISINFASEASIFQFRAIARGGVDNTSFHRQQVYYNRNSVKINARKVDPRIRREY